MFSALITLSAHRTLWLVTLAFVCSQANLIRLLGPLEPSIFALQLAFTPAQFWGVIDAWGHEGVMRYQSHFMYDFLHPFVYALFGYLWVKKSTLFTQWSPLAIRFWAAALPIAGACDVLENSLHLKLLALGPAPQEYLIVLISGLASSIKWSLAVLFTFGLLKGLLRHDPPH